MSAQCPKCRTPIEQDFGVIQCPKCATVVVIDMDGNIQGAEESAEQVFALSEDSESPQPAQLRSHEIGDLPDHDSMVFQLDAEVSLESTDDGPEPIVAMNEVAEEEFIESAAEEPPAEIIPLDPIKEIAAFGNADLTTNPLSYTLVREGIDNKDIRESLRQALREPKFNWNVAEMMSRVKGGRLEIRKIDPVKASILVRRLQDLPVKVGWRQHAFENS